MIGENPSVPHGDLHRYVMGLPLREIGLQSGGSVTSPPVRQASRANVFEDVSRPQGIGVFERSLSVQGRLCSLRIWLPKE